MNQEEARAVLKSWHQHIGRKGGVAMTEKKRASSKANAEKARKARLEKRKLGGK